MDRGLVPRKFRDSLVRCTREEVRCAHSRPILNGAPRLNLVIREAVCYDKRWMRDLWLRLYAQKGYEWKRSGSPIRESTARNLPIPRSNRGRQLEIPRSPAFVPLTEQLDGGAAPRGGHHRRTTKSAPDARYTTPKSSTRSRQKGECHDGVLTAQISVEFSGVVAGRVRGRAG
jgi:hypothetical protein